MRKEIILPAALIGMGVVNLGMTAITLRKVVQHGKKIDAMTGSFVKMTEGAHALTEAELKTQEAAKANSSKAKKSTKTDDSEVVKATEIADALAAAIKAGAAEKAEAAAETISKAANKVK